MKKRILSVLIVMCMFPSSGWAQLRETSYSEPLEADAMMEKVVETTSQPYVRERETIIHQLEIITGDEETKYIIVPGDTLTVVYMDRSEKKESVYQVNGEGKISMELVGEVKVGGFNRKQTREHLNRMMQQYIRNPRLEVYVNIAGRYMVAGEVEEPGVFRLRSNLTVMEAIMASNYDQDEVNLKSVMVMRGSPDNVIALRLDLNKFVKKGDRSDNILVKPGDFIFVPRRFIANIEKFIETAYRYVEAYYGLGKLPRNQKKGYQVFFE